MSESLKATPELSPEGRIWHLVEMLIPDENVEILPYRRLRGLWATHKDVLRFSLPIRPVDDESIGKYSVAMFRVERIIGRTILGVNSHEPVVYSCLVINLKEPLATDPKTFKPVPEYRRGGKIIEYNSGTRGAKWVDSSNTEGTGMYTEEDLTSLLESIYEAQLIPIYNPEDNKATEL